MDEPDSGLEVKAVAISNAEIMPATRYNEPPTKKRKIIGGSRYQPDEYQPL